MPLSGEGLEAPQNAASFIDGFYRESSETYANIDPSTGMGIGTVARAGSAEVDEAVASASAVNREWKLTTPERRAHLLTRLADLILKNAELLARIESEDSGKPLAQARVDASVCARYFRFYGHAIDSYYGISLPLREDLHVYTRREPFGVTGHILAWNYPMQLLGRAVAPAIATGNCSVVKPADETPRTALMIAELAIKAGIPAGVFNVVTGIGSEAGAALAAHQGIDHLGFVGSAQVGSLIAHAAADRVVPSVLELGGKSPHIVFQDADLSAAARQVANGILQNAGQTCSAGSRLLVHRSVHDELMDRLVRIFEGVRIGPALDDPDLGPLVSTKQQQRVRRFMEGLVKGEVLTGGGVPANGDFGAGCFFLPTLVDNVDPDAAIAQEEVFGPVLVANSFDEEDEAIHLANGTSYALMAAVWTMELSRAHRFAAELVAGQVYVNSYGAGGGVELPFGGFKKSGFGREKGREALDAFTQTKTVVMKI